MSDIKPTDEQLEAAEQFLLRECVDDIVEVEADALLVAKAIKKYPDGSTFTGRAEVLPVGVVVAACLAYDGGRR